MHYRSQVEEPSLKKKRSVSWGFNGSYVLKFLLKFLNPALLIGEDSIACFIRTIITLIVPVDVIIVFDVLYIRQLGIFIIFLENIILSRERLHMDKRASLEI